MPNDYEFKYLPYGEFDDSKTPRPHRPQTFRGGSNVAAEMRRQADPNCKPKSKQKVTKKHDLECSATAKGNMLLKLEHYSWFDTSTPQDVKAEAHRLRFCRALKAARASAELDKSNARTVDDIKKRTERNSAILSEPTARERGD